MHTIILGDSDHAEVKAIMSYASSGVSVVSSLDEIDSLPDFTNCFVVAQTTLEQDFYNRAVQKLQMKYKNCTIYNTICDATTKRQNDVLSAVKKGVS